MFPRSEITRSIKDCEFKCLFSYDTRERKRAFSNINDDNLIQAQYILKFYAEKTGSSRSTSTLVASDKIAKMVKKTTAVVPLK